MFSFSKCSSNVINNRIIIIFKFNKIFVISDRSSQSFSSLEDIVTDSEAYIGREETVSKIYCYKNCYGYDKDGKVFTAENVEASTYDGYLMYTYSDKKDGLNLYLTFWREKTW